MKLYRDGVEVADAVFTGASGWSGRPILDHSVPLDYSKKFGMTVSQAAIKGFDAQKWELGEGEARLEIELVKPSFQADDLQIIVALKKG